MSEISQEKKEELLELVEKQKKAKISWVATITQIPEELIIKIAPELNLTIEGDQILLHSQTIDGKRNATLEKNKKRIIDLALNERVHRGYYTITKESNKPFWDRGLLGMYSGQDPNRSSKEEGKTIASAIIYKLDGTVKSISTSLDEIKSIKDKLYQQMINHSKDNIHYFVPISSYYKLIEIPKKAHLLKDRNLTKRVIEECNRLEKIIGILGSELIKNSTVVLSKGFWGVGERYKVRYPSRKEIICTKQELEMYKLSLFLHFRTNMNCIYYDLVKKGAIPDIIDFLLGEKGANSYTQEINFRKKLNDSSFLPNK